MEIEKIDGLIHLLRGHRVMVDSDLSALYGVRTKELNKAVARNRGRFPPDFMFRISTVEMEYLRFQSGTSKGGRGGRRYLPFAFTEQGVAMLSSVLKSERAVQVNVEIIRTFVRLRHVLVSDSSLADRLTELEKRLSDHEEEIGDQVIEIQSLFEDIRRIVGAPSGPKRRIGFSI